MLPNYLVIVLCQFKHVLNDILVATAMCSIFVKFQSINPTLLV